MGSPLARGGNLKGEHMNTGDTTGHTVTLTEYGTALKAMGEAARSFQGYSIGHSLNTNKDPNKVLGQDEHHQKIYWDNFAKINCKQNVIASTGYAGTTQLMFICPDCEACFLTFSLHLIETNEEALSVIEKQHEHFNKHKERCEGEVPDESVGR